MSATIEKLKRLGDMTAHELAHRVREKLYSERDRIRQNKGKPAPKLAITFKNYLAGAPARRFYPGTREDLRGLMRASFPEFINQAVEEAERLCRHEVELLGRGPVHLGAEIDWHRDPVNGCVWERTYWADYHPTNDRLGRDTKIVHELNRHQHLPRLAKAYRLTGDERYAREAVGQINGWIEQNPPGLGINWQSSLEIAIRSISWLWTIFLVLPSDSFDEASAQRIGESLFAQLDHVGRYTSLFSSPNTHLIGEAAALFIAGTVFHGQEQAGGWLETGLSLLRREVRKQVSPDGVYGELSSYYHCYALDFYLQAMVLASQNQLRMPRHVRHGVRSMLEFLMHLTRPDGTIPMLGDDDGGRALALARKDYRSFQDSLSVGAVLFRSGAFKHQAGPFAEEALWLLGVDAWETFRQLGEVAPAERSGSFTSAGYWTQRSGWGPNDSHLVFDCGGLGILAGGHAHADALSFTLFSNGRELLVDPGTFVYNGSPEWRSYFRSTRAHNTVVIDGLDQAEQAGTFRWKTHFHSRVTEQYIMPDIEYVEGEHDGYARLAQGVVHRRRMVHVAPECWIVVDDFRGSGEHRFDFHYHFAPDVRLSSLERDDSSIGISAEHSGLRLSLFTSQPLTSTDILRGEDERFGGWASRAYGDRKPCSTVCATLSGPVPAAGMTFIEPNASPESSVERLELEYGEGIACAWRHGDFEDIAVFSIGDAPLAVAGFKMHGEFFWLRREHGCLRQVFAIRAYSLADGRTAFFRRSEPGPYYVVDAASKEETICVESAEL